MQLLLCFFYSDNRLDNMNKSILVIGNGFDLDLGLKTKYSDFAKSSFWPKVDFNSLPITPDGYILDFGDEPHNISMIDYIETIRNLVLEDKTWFDLENELLNYATNYAPHNTFSTAKEDKIYFNNLRLGLHKFIEQEQKKSSPRINVDSCAANVLKTSCFDMVYSFNYTDINQFGKSLGLSQEIQCQHLHGDLSNNSIILGVNETKLATGYAWLHKTSSRHYPSHDVYNALKDAKDIIFFGLSFGSIDFIYFKRFFQELSSGNAIEENSKQNITIVTKNDDSQFEIKDRIREMDVDVQRLFEQSHLDFIITDEKRSQERLNEILSQMYNGKMIKWLLNN